MRKRRVSRSIARLGAGAAFVGVSLAPVLAWPQAEAPASSQASASQVIDEVIVTARRREERLVDTPIAVSAMSGDDLRERGIYNIEELTKSVPSLQISEGQSNQIYIRGVGERTGFVRIDPTVGVYLDDLLIPRSDGQLLDIVDVESVQVLRGPQGTLFGKNTTGGAIVVTLVKPHDEFEGYIEGGVGSFNQRRARAAVNVPVTDRFYTRVAANFIEDDGFIRDVSGQRSDSTGRQSALLQTRWDATDDFRLDGLAFYGRIRERFAGVNCTVANPEAQLAGGLFAMWEGDTDPANPSAFQENCNRNSRERLGDRRTDLGPTVGNLDHDLETIQLGLTAEWHYHHNHMFKAVAGFRDATRGEILNGDQDNGPANFQEAHQPEDSDRRSYSMELQFIGSAFDDRLSYAAGLFGMRETNDEVFLLTSNMIGFDLTTAIALADGEIVQPPPGGTTALVSTLSSPRLESRFDLENTSWAAYFQTSLDIIEGLQLTLGVRHTEERRESNLTTIDTDLAAVGERIAEHPQFGPAVAVDGFIFNIFNGEWAEDPVGIAAAMFPDETGDGIKNFPMDRDNPLVDHRKETFSETTPMASLSYNLPHSWVDPLRFDDVMVYATYSEGFKSGFFEPRLVDGLQRVEPEELENREIGLKIDAFDRRVRLSMALYSMRFKNMQLVQVQTDSENNLAVVFDNAGRSEIEGGELELTWLPGPRAVFNLSYSNNTYEFTEFDDLELFAKAIRGEDVPVDRTDEPFPVSPEEQFSAGFQYAWETGIGTFVPRVDVSYQSDTFLGLDRGSFEAYERDKSLAGQEAYTLLDVRLSWRNPAGNATATLYAKNVTDKRYRVGTAAVGDSIGTFGQAYGDPRRVGIDMRYTF